MSPSRSRRHGLVPFLCWPGDASAAPCAGLLPRGPARLRAAIVLFSEDQPASAIGARREVLERDTELSALADAVQAAAGGVGCVVLIMGEAGIGKSSLVEALRARLPGSGRMLVGYCDDLATPRTLGPFRDLAGNVRAELSRAVTDGSDRDRVLAALHAELSWPEHPTVLVIEDVHWADDATLDALRFLIRRVADLPAVLILTYRDDELDREHPL